VRVLHVGSDLPGDEPERDNTLFIGRPPTESVFRQAAERIMMGAEPLRQNAFKVDLGRHAVVRALSKARGL
jgi:xanthine dehydrogenase YagS FAD-binding subunit